MRQHLSPYRPVVVCIWPDVQPVRDVLLMQDAREPFIACPADVPVRSAQNDPHVPEFRIAVIRKKVDRVIKIGIVIIEAVQLIPDIECTADAVQVTDQPGMSEREIGCMVATKTAACDHQFGMAGFLTRHGCYFFQDQFVIPDVVFYPLCGMDAFIVPAHFIDAVYAIHFDETFIDEPADGLNHLEILALIIPAHAAGKKDHRIAAVAEGQELKIGT